MIVIIFGVKMVLLIVIIEKERMRIVPIQVEKNVKYQKGKEENEGN